MFKVVSGSNAPYRTWINVDRITGASLYVGQLVKTDTGSFDGAAPLAAASGVYDVGGDQAIYGVVAGTNDLTPTFVATYGQYIAPVASAANQVARRQFGAFGNQSKGDPCAKVLVDVCDPTTILRGDIYNATVGVAPTLLTVTTGSSTGAGFTSNACDVATVAGLCTAYCRKGANAGIYRTTTSASTTIQTVTTCFPFPIAVGDQFVIVPLKQRGMSYGNITYTSGYLGMGLDSSKTAATDYFGINVLEMDLSEAGKEHVIFRFAPCHYDGLRYT